MVILASFFENLSLDYIAVIAASLIIILSYFFNVLSQKTNIPSVIMLIALGILIKTTLDFIEVGDINEVITRYKVLPIIGTIGLIFIVLEAALDLKLTEEKWPVIWRSFTVALLGLITTTFVIAYILDVFVFQNFIQSVVYAIPMSIMSSAIIIPSVKNLEEDKKEFMIYESTLSDILGIMFFFYLEGNVGNPTNQIVGSIILNIVLTLILSLVVSFAMVWVFQKIRSQVKLFLILAILCLLYAVGKLFHLSSLILILIFGLMLNNSELFFRGKLKQLVNHKELKPLLHDFHILTLESAFIIRTFFFVIFGVTIVLASLLDFRVAFISLIIIFAVYAIRFLWLRIFLKDHIDPLLLIAPRGLITILLFFAIPVQYQSDDFNSGILLFVIIASSLFMTYSLIAYANGNKAAELPREEPLLLFDSYQPEVSQDTNTETPTPLE